MYVGLISKIALLSIVLMPVTAFAQWSGWDDDWEGPHRSPYREAIENLDDNLVENLPIPVLVGVEIGDLTDNFGDSRDGGSRTHEGLDMLAREGTPIASPTEAVVVRIGNGSGSGRYVRTANPGGESFVYMHLDSIAENLDVGDELERGDIIGFVGNTGNASGGPAHLHFEIRDDGVTDPLPRLTRVFTSKEREDGLAEALKQGGSRSVIAELQTEYADAAPVAVRASENAEANILLALFARDLELGMEGSDVLVLQIFLNAQGYTVASSGAGSPGSETMYFGSLTQAALSRYQAANGISPTAGYFGPLTRAHLASSLVI